MKFDLQRQFCNAKLNYKIYYYDHDIRGYLICSSHKFSPFGRVGHLTFCYCYWQFVVSFLLSGTEGQRGKQSASKKEIHRERGTARGESAGNLCARLGWLYEILLIIAERQPAQTYLNYFHFNCKHTHTSVYTHTNRHRDTHTFTMLRLAWRRNQLNCHFTYEMVICQWTQQLRVVSGVSCWWTGQRPTIAEGVPVCGLSNGRINMSHSLGPSPLSTCR